MISRNSLLILVILLIALIQQISLANQNKQTIVYPRQGTVDGKTGYPLQLLHLAFRKENVDTNIQLIPSEIDISQNRVIKLLEQNVIIDIGWNMSSSEREKNLLTVKFPIYKGLYGYRVFMIHSDNQALFPPSLRKADLRGMTALQGFDWPDTRILRYNGFNVVTTNQHQSLFDMISAKRADFFPRSVLEIGVELDIQNNPSLALEENYLLQYPAYIYFFVNPSSTQLHEIISNGLQKAKQDGSFDKLFNSIYLSTIKRVNIEQRKVIQLGSPYHKAK